jgi:hypothetical protein
VRHAGTDDVLLPPGERAGDGRRLGGRHQVVLAAAEEERRGAHPPRVVDRVVRERVEALAPAAPEHEQVRERPRGQVARLETMVDGRDQAVERALQHERSRAERRVRLGLQHGCRPHRDPVDDDRQAAGQGACVRGGGGHVLRLVEADAALVAAGAAAAAEVHEERGEAEIAEDARLAQEVALGAAVAVEEHGHAARPGPRQVPGLEEGAVEAAHAVALVGAAGMAAAARPRETGHLQGERLGACLETAERARGPVGERVRRAGGRDEREESPADAGAGRHVDAALAGVVPRAFRGFSRAPRERLWSPARVYGFGATLFGVFQLMTKYVAGVSPTFFAACSSIEAMNA